MTAQVTDPFFWKGEEYVFNGAEDVYSLFDPEKYGLHPKAFCTACWKGFIITFGVRDDQLYIDELDIYCEDEKYPAINGVEATDDGWLSSCRYSNLNIATQYTGTITISQDMKEGAIRGAFTDGPGYYKKNYELVFKNGKLIDYRETTGNYYSLCCDDE